MAATMTKGAGAFLGTTEHDVPSRFGGWGEISIGGEWVRSGSSSRIDDTDPYSGETIASVSAATGDDVERAFDAADDARRRYTERTPQELAQPILDAIELLRANADKVAELLTAESGSCVAKARFEVEQVTIPMMQEAASFPFRAFGTNIRSRIPGKQNLVQRLPAGVVSVISPWNFPLHLSMRAVAPALALGNAVVVKPSSDTPITGGLLLAELFEHTSLPKGLLSVVPGRGEEVGDRVAGHPKNNVVAFTGSTEVGRGVAS
jgi:aldehyde dehydrogenase (NAD+)